VEDITYRDLEPEEAGLIATIDRTEVIDGRYEMIDGKLVLNPLHHVVTGWYPSEITDHTGNIQRMLAEGGRAFGAWHESELVRLVGMDVTGVGGDPGVLQLEPLHVSAPWRNRGIGKTLVALLADAARDRGATAIYISSIPTRNAVDAYLKMGARLADPPDPVLFEREPEDIHLLLSIAPAVQ
jgi:GNAT superfamily N-acetyltransferase